MQPIELIDEEDIPDLSEPLDSEENEDDYDGLCDMCYGIGDYCVFCKGTGSSQKILK